MSRKKRRSKTYRLPLDRETLEKLARKLMDDRMIAMIDHDFRLCGSSGIWRKANGRLTMRFSYRNPAGRSITQTLRDVPDPRTWATWSE